MVIHGARWVGDTGFSGCLIWQDTKEFNGLLRRDLRDAPAAIADRKGARVPVRLTLFPLRDRDKTVGGVAILRVDPGAGGAAGAGREGLS